MKKIGFLTEKMEVVIVTKNIDTTTTTHSPELITKICEYLSAGKEVISYMHISIDENSNAIGPYCIMTDGVWIWPSYFSYFLKRYPDLKVESEFIDFIKNNNFKIKQFDLKAVVEEYLKRPGIMIT
ncbi:MAG: hypothetical protein JSS79_07670 [Bacteroidetes bacterium]|nr:hypothetical protein [Bacteroidota bacterium]